MTGPRTSASASRTPRTEEDRHQARVEAAGADDHGVELADGVGDRRVNLDRRVEPDRGRRRVAVRLPASTSTSPRVVGAVAVLRAQADAARC